MKYLSKILFLSLVVSTMFTACKKDENQLLFQGGSNPVLTASRANNSVIPMSFATKDNEAIKFMWTNPDYKFNTGLSSQDVNYRIEIDTTGSNFTNPNRRLVSVSQDLSKSMTQSELNDIMLNNMLLNSLKTYNLDVRIRANLVNNSTVPEMISNTMKFTVTPYAIPPKVALPSSGELYIVGSATPGGWSNPVPAPAQKFTQVSPTQYEITLNGLVGGQSYLFLPVNGSWSDKYGFDGANNANNEMADNLKQGGGDMKAPAASGNYKIVVDFQRGRFTLTKL